MTGVQPFSGASGLCDTLDELRKRRRADPPLLHRRDDAGTRGDLLCRSAEHLVDAGDGSLCAEGAIHLSQVGLVDANGGPALSGVIRRAPRVVP
jgi:hypothetical protein